MIVNTITCFRLAIPYFIFLQDKFSFSIISNEFAASSSTLWQACLLTT